MKQAPIQQGGPKPIDLELTIPNAETPCNCVKAPCGCGGHDKDLVEKTIQNLSMAVKTGYDTTKKEMQTDKAIKIGLGLAAIALVYVIIK